MEISGLDWNDKELITLWDQAKSEFNDLYSINANPSLKINTKKLVNPNNNPPKFKAKNSSNNGKKQSKKQKVSAQGASAPAGESSEEEIDEFANELLKVYLDGYSQPLECDYEELRKQWFKLGQMTGYMFEE